MRPIIVMTKEEQVLEHQCIVVNKEVSFIVDKYIPTMSDCPAVIDQLRKAENRSKEFKNGTFIVLVVGPVKSGKSTLVNLIANACVSPTHFLECTVRPSIISQRREGEDSKITVFTSEDTDNRVEQIDAVIDCIRGIANEDSLLDSHIKKSVFDLTPENIKEKVELGLHESLTSETLVTSITTPGGKLMQQNVFIVDMPGFDGEYANIDNPIYDTVAQRADLIIFVQSSNSAISKVSSQFLKKLSDNNQAVPVCLIHNVFDSSWWHSEEERKAMAADQIRFAVGEIRKKGFNVDEKRCFSINLGQVEDGRKPMYSEHPKLKSEVKKYEQIETDLYEHVIEQRNAMRLEVCLNRTGQQLDKTVGAINNELEHRSQMKTRYEQAEVEFDKVRSGRVFNSTLNPLTVDYALLKNIVRDKAKRYNKIVGASHNHMTNKEAVKIISDFISSCEEGLSASFGKLLSLSEAENKLYSDCKIRMVEIENVVRRFHPGHHEPKVDLIPIEGVPSLSIEKGVINQSLIRKIKVLWFGGHSREDVEGYINKAKECLVGSDAGEEGYLEEEGGAIKPVLSCIQQLLDGVAKKYETICDDYWAQGKKEVLDGIIADKTAFDDKTLQLEQLKQELSKIKEKL